MDLESGDERFTCEDLYGLCDLVASAWTAGAGRDWTVPAGRLEWSCIHTADHAVDCVFAPAFFLASRLRDRYPDVGKDLTIGEEATPALVVQSLQIATRILAAVVADAEPGTTAVIFRRPQVLTGCPADFLPRAGVELILHAHDVCAGLGLSFDPPPELCRRLREHTRPWPMWGRNWQPLRQSDDPWGDLLAASGRS